jgi:hypothetical protein
MIWLVTTDRRESEPGRFAGAVRGLGDAIEPLPGVWLLHAALASDQIRHVLRPILGSDERLLILSCGHEAAVHNLAPQHIDWMNGEFPFSLTERTEVDE